MQNGNEMKQYIPPFRRLLMCSFLFIIREFQFVFTWFFVVRITSIATLESFKLPNKDKVASRGNMEDFPSNFDFLWIQKVSGVELDLVHRLMGRSEGFVNLHVTFSICDTNATMV